MTIYLSGPMTGYDDYNRAAFNAAAASLRAMGHLVFNPAETFACDVSLPRHVYMRIDIAAVLKAEVVATLPGWKQSRGALLEVTVARECGIPVRPWSIIDPDVDFGTHSYEMEDGTIHTTLNGVCRYE